MYFAKEEGRITTSSFPEILSHRPLNVLRLRQICVARWRTMNYLWNIRPSWISKPHDHGCGGLTALEKSIPRSVTPTQFIPVAEETGLIVPIGRWVIKTACAQNVAWQRQGLPHVCVAVNLSLRQLMDEHLIGDIKSSLEDSGMAPNLLELEITESMVMHILPLIAVLTDIRK